jgi:hypothetical protein
MVSSRFRLKRLPEMKKHLHAASVPDHMSGFIGKYFEVIEVMMAKNRNERYKTMEETLADLQAVRDGKPPLIARRRFDIESLGELEHGDIVEMPNNRVSKINEELITKYKMYLIILGALSAILLLAVIFLAWLNNYKGQ